MNLLPLNSTHPNTPSGFESLVNQTESTFQSMERSLEKSPLNSAAASWAMRVLNQKVEEEISLSLSERQFLVQQLTSFAVAVELGTVTPDLVQNALRQLKERQ
jgi:hypothetical protein